MRELINGRGDNLLSDVKTEILRSCAASQVSRK